MKKIRFIIKQLLSYQKYKSMFIKKYLESLRCENINQQKYRSFFFFFFLMQRPYKKEIKKVNTSKAVNIIKNCSKIKGN